jgi:hypothetical protein
MVGADVSPRFKDDLGGASSKHTGRLQGERGHSGCGRTTRRGKTAGCEHMVWDLGIPGRASLSNSREGPNLWGWPSAAVPSSMRARSAAGVHGVNDGV